MDPRPVVIADPIAIRRELARTKLKTLGKLADRASIARGTLSALMAGKPVSPESLYRLALALGLAEVRE